MYSTTAVNYDSVRGLPFFDILSILLWSFFCSLALSTLLEVLLLIDLLLADILALLFAASPHPCTSGRLCSTQCLREQWRHFTLNSLILFLHLEWAHVESSLLISEISESRSSLEFFVITFCSGFFLTLVFLGLDDAVDDALVTLLISKQSLTSVRTSLSPVVPAFILATVLQESVSAAVISKIIQTFSWLTNCKIYLQ